MDGLTGNTNTNIKSQILNMMKREENDYLWPQNIRKTVHHPYPDLFYSIKNSGFSYFSSLKNDEKDLIIIIRGMDGWMDDTVVW